MILTRKIYLLCMFTLLERKEFGHITSKFYSYIGPIPVPYASIIIIIIIIYENGHGEWTTMKILLYQHKIISLLQRKDYS